MSLYLTRARYSQDAFKSMVAGPSDREAAGRAMFAAAGIKLHHMRYSGNGEVICVVEGNAVAGSIAGMVVMASGGLTAVETTELITMGPLVEAMKGAGAVAATVPSARQVIHARGASAGPSFSLRGASPHAPRI